MAAERHPLASQGLHEALAEGFGDTSLCVLPNLNPGTDCLKISRAPGTFGSLQVKGVWGSRGLEKSWADLFGPLKEAFSSVGTKNFLAPTIHCLAMDQDQVLSFQKLEVYEPG